jgi:hypothetical protein
MGFGRRRAVCHPRDLYSARCRAFRLIGPDGLGAFLAESLARDLPPSSRLLNPSDTKVTLGIQMLSNPAEAYELVFLNSKNAPMLATLTVVPPRGTEQRVAELSLQGKGNLSFTYLFAIFVFSVVNYSLSLLGRWIPHIPPKSSRLRLWKG